MIPTFSPASDKYPADLNARKWEQIEPHYRELIGRDLHCKNCLHELIMDRSELDAIVSEAGSNLYINMSCHTDDEQATKAYLDFVENVQPKLREAAFELDRKIAQCPHAKDLDPRRFEVYLRDTRLAVDLFRPENIPLETELAKLDQEYSQICGAMTVQFRGEERTLPQMARFNEEPDRQIREDAWRGVAERRFKDADAIDAIFEKMIDLRTRIAKNAGFTNFRDYAHKSKRRFDYTPETCHEFARGVEQVCVPIQRKLMADRSRVMGISPLSPWDGQVDPKGRPALRPFEGATQLLDRTNRVFRRMDASLAEMFEFLQQGGHGQSTSCLDLESRRGKAPGGYQAMRDRVRKPFIFMNAAGMQRDVETIVHEAGHAFHSLLCRAEPILGYRSEIALEFCEVASMSMELTSHPFLDEYYSPADADRARRTHLESIVSSLCTIAMVDQFQHWIYTNPGHTRAQRHEKWAELVRRFGPGFDWSGLEAFLATGWHRILHLFGTPFYYIEYGIAQLGALSVWLNYRSDPRSAIDKYKAGLALGGSRPLPELFRTAGIEFDFGPSTIGKLMRSVEADLARMPA